MSTRPEVMTAALAAESIKATQGEDEMLDPGAPSSPHPAVPTKIPGIGLEGTGTVLPGCNESIFRTLAQFDGASVIEIHWKGSDLELPPHSILPPKKKPIEGRRPPMKFYPFASMGATELTVGDLRAAIASASRRWANS